MKIRVYITLVLCLYLTTGFAQDNLNDYKYVIIPKSYSFLKGVEDKYQLNSLTKFLFEKYGFKALNIDDEYPIDLNENPCLAVAADVKSDSKLFVTKLSVTLMDCRNRQVYESVVGKSKEKQYKIAYQESLRNAFMSIKTLNYKYEPSTAPNSTLTANKTTASTENLEKNVEAEKPVVMEEKEVAKNEIKVAAVPVVIAAEPKPEEKEMVEKESVVEEEEAFVAKSYGNENISFFLIAQNDNLVAYVNDSKDNAYKKGEMIGTLRKTSIPNVYRVNWKDSNGKNNETTGYFDDSGNLKIDVNKDGKIEVVTFEVEEN